MILLFHVIPHSTFYITKPNRYQPQIFSEKYLRISPPYITRIAKSEKKPEKLMKNIPRIMRLRLGRGKVSNLKNGRRVGVSWYQVEEIIDCSSEGAI